MGLTDYGRAKGLAESRGMNNLIGFKGNPEPSFEFTLVNLEDLQI